MTFIMVGPYPSLSEHIQVTDTHQAVSTPTIISEYARDQFILAVGRIAKLAYENSRDKGFWKDDESPEYLGNKIMLMVTELAEAVEGIRKPGDLSAFSRNNSYMQVEEELADCVIRILDYAARFNLHLADAVIAKIEYNANRPFMHGKTM